MDDEIIIPRRITAKYLSTLTDEQKEYVIEYKKQREREKDRVNRRNRRNKNKIVRPITKDNVPVRLGPYILEQLTAEEKEIVFKIKKDRIRLSKKKYYATHREAFLKNQQRYRKRKKERENVK